MTGEEIEQQIIKVITREEIEQQIIKDRDTILDAHIKALDIPEETQGAFKKFASTLLNIHMMSLSALLRQQIENTSDNDLRPLINAHLDAMGMLFKKEIAASLMNLGSEPRTQEDAPEYE